MSASVVMLDKTAEKPEVVYTTDTPDLIALETRDDGIYYVAKKAGEAKITATVIDPVSSEEFVLEDTLFVKAIEMENHTIEPNQTVQMTYRLLPNDEVFPSYYTTEWTSADESIATVDENGLVTGTDKEGTAEIELTVKSFGTIYYHAVATVTVKEPVVNTAPMISAEDKILVVGDVFDPLKDVTATDNEDGDITDDIEVIKNDVDADTVGTYEVIYRVADSEGEIVEKTIIVTVKEPEKVNVVFNAILDDNPELIVTEKQFVKGSEMDMDMLKDLNALLDELAAESFYQGYQCTGFFLDKEGNQPLRLGYHFNDDTAIYMIWESVDNPPEQPTEPEEPEKPEPEKPTEPDQPTEQPTNPEKPITPEKPIKPNKSIQPNKPSEPEKLPINHGAENIKTGNESDIENSVATGDFSLFSLYMTMLSISGLCIAVFYTIRKKNEINN